MPPLIKKRSGIDVRRNDDELVVGRKMSQSMHFQQAIKQFGLSDYEARVYVAALRLGIASITEVAKAAHIPRTTCYHVLESLGALGFINYFIGRKRGSKKMYSAENPDKFIMLLREREAVIKEIIPQLKALHREQGHKPTVYFYDRVEGIKKIFGDILDAQRPFLAITSIDDALKVLGTFFEHFMSRRYGRKIPVKLLTNKTKKSLELKKRDAQALRQTRFLPEQYVFKTANFIYGNKVALISFNRDIPMGLIIEDEYITQTHQMFFEIAWSSAVGA